MAVPENDSAASLCRPSAADSWIDDLVPDELDWRGMVRSYPFTALSVAAVGGFLVGRFHGERIIESLSELAARRVDETVDRFIDLARERSHLS